MGRREPLACILGPAHAVHAPRRPDSRLFHRQPLQHIPAPDPDRALLPVPVRVHDLGPEHLGALAGELGDGVRHPRRRHLRAAQRRGQPDGHPEPVRARERAQPAGPGRVAPAAAAQQQQQRAAQCREQPQRVRRRGERDRRGAEPAGQRQRAAVECVKEVET